MVDIKKNQGVSWSSNSASVDSLPESIYQSRVRQHQARDIQKDTYVNHSASSAAFFGKPKVASSAVYSMDPSSVHFAEAFGQKYSQATRNTWSSVGAFFQDWHTRGFAQLLSRYTPHLPHVSQSAQPVPPPKPQDNTTPNAQRVDGTVYRPMRLPTEARELFSSAGPQAGDVQQGALGDCYFLSTLTGVAIEHPHVIRDNIKPHVDEPSGKTIDGLYDVRFYNQSPTGEAQEQWVTVNSSVLCDSQGHELYAGAQDVDNDGRQEIWAAIYEKAYAEFRKGDGTIDDGYQRVGEGGLGDEAYFALTGRRAFINDPSLMSHSELMAILNRTNPIHGDAVMVGSKSSDDVLVADGILSGHLYTVLGTYDDPQTNEPMVTLRNPWGMYEPGVGANAQGDWYPPIGVLGNDGVFSIPVRQLRGDFDLITYPASSDFDLSPPRSQLGG
jgi:hypothetical protein